MAIPCCDIFGEGNGPIHFYNVSCTGPETIITDCDYQNNTVITSHQQDVGVQCQQGMTVCEHNEFKSSDACSCVYAEHICSI